MKKLFKETQTGSLLKSILMSALLKSEKQMGYHQIILDCEKGLFGLFLQKVLSLFGCDAVETLTRLILELGYQRKVLSNLT